MGPDFLPVKHRRKRGSRRSRDEDFIMKSTGKERKKEEKAFINKFINNKYFINGEIPERLFNKQTIVKSVSFRREHFPLLINFMEKAKLERTSWSSKTGFSELARKAFTEYLERHPLPNPQATLDRSLNLNMPHKPSWQCCVPNCRGKARFHLFLKDFDGNMETFQVCHRHKKWKHPRYKFLKGMKEVG